MITFEVSVVIEKPLEQVFGFVAAGENGPKVEFSCEGCNEDLRRTSERGNKIFDYTSIAKWKC